MTGSLSMILTDQTIICVALPRIQRDFSASSTNLQQIISAYVLSYASFLAFAGKLCDVIGRVKTFRLGVVVFTLGSMMCGFSPNVQILILSRVLQGFGGAIMQPASTAIVISTFDINEPKILSSKGFIISNKLIAMH